LRGLPTGWIECRVDEAGEIRLGRQRSPEHHIGEYMRPYLRVANVYEDRIDTTSILRMNFTPQEFKVYELKHGDILLNEGQSLNLVGRPAMFRGELPGACFQNTLVRFRPRPCVDARFALLEFRYFLHTQRFQRIARWTTNIAHLGSERFAAMGFLLPPLAEQRRIVAEIEKQFTRLDAVVAALKRSQANLQRYRASVSKAAVEGRLVRTESELATQDRRVFESGRELVERVLREKPDSTHTECQPNLNEVKSTPSGWARARWAVVGRLRTVAHSPVANTVSRGSSSFARGISTPTGMSSGRRKTRPIWPIHGLTPFRPTSLAHLRLS